MIIRGEPPTRYLTRTKGDFVVRYLSHGRIVIAKRPPRKRGMLAPGVIKNIIAWDQAQRMVKYPAPEEYVEAYEATDGTAFYARDQLIMAMYGHSISWPGIGWKEQEMQNIQQLLNSLCTDPGALIYRGPQLWACVPLGLPGQLLTLDADALPAWSNPKPAGASLPLVNGDAYNAPGGGPVDDLLPGQMLDSYRQLIAVII
jgi:hypothetical protein